MISTYHLFTKWPKVIVFGVYGIAKNHNAEETISHYWLEIENVVIDLTADQYNIIDDSELNRKIVEKRPFNSIYIDFSNNVFYYGLFKVLERDKYIKGFPTVKEDFIKNMQISYRQLAGKMIRT